MGKTEVDIEGISSSHKAMFGGAVEVMNRPSTVSIVLSPAHHGIRPTQFPQSILPTPVVSPSQRRLYVLSGWWSPSPSCAGFGASNEAFWVLRKLFLLVNDLVERKEEDKEEVGCGGDGKDPRKAKKKDRKKEKNRKVIDSS